ncbi:IclR family transcriptional regulator [Yersinia bercovieri]|uniref:IclR family transcriptional regulator n=1 Tax=Yersinia bercovieri TaxID=634 RepID=UPI0011A8A090|nr:IclR family transcriptional regulator [Yersinia bercovieri]
MINESKLIQSLERAMTLLEVISSTGGKSRLVDLSEALGVSKSTLHGLLNTLAAMGYITRHGTKYALGLRLREIAQPLWDADAGLRLTFAPALRELAEQSGETCYLAVACGTREYLYIDVMEGISNLRVASPRGRREGLTTSAIGKIFLAHDADLLRSLRRAGVMLPPLEKELKEIALRGYALDLEEAETGLNCLALPLRQQGKVVAALGVAGPAWRLSKLKIHNIVTKLEQKKYDIIEP